MDCEQMNIGIKSEYFHVILHGENEVYETPLLEPKIYQILRIWGTIVCLWHICMLCILTYI